MKCLNDIYLFENKELMDKMVRWSLYTLFGLLIILPALLLLLSKILTGDWFFYTESISSIGYILWSGCTVILCIIIFLAHELIHGLFFLLLGPRDIHILFGHDFSHGVLYATAPRVVYPWYSFIAILLAPTICISLVCIAVGIWSGWWVCALVSFALHLCGCSGDWVFVEQIVQAHQEGCNCVMDTKDGIALLHHDAQDVALPYCLSAQQERYIRNLS